MFAVPGRRDAYEGYQLISSSYCDPTPAEIRSLIDISNECAVFDFLTAMPPPFAPFGEILGDNCCSARTLLV